jgi:hypothetical protein
MRRLVVVFVSIAVAFVAAVGFGVWYTWPKERTATNPARDRVEAVLPKLGLEQIHGTKLCDYSLDHTLLRHDPRYSAYFEVDRTDDLDARVMTAMRAAGFDPKQLSGSDSDPTTTAFSAGPDDGTRMYGQVTRDGTNFSECRSEVGDARPLSAPRGRAILALSLTVHP